MPKVAVAMSGGVDSSVAAALVREAGREAVGVTMILWGGEPDNAPALASARQACERLGIAHETLDLRDAFRQRIIEYFAAGYAAGATPNPCVRCNEQVKFGLLIQRMEGLGAGVLATGHYARIQGPGQGPGQGPEQGPEKGPATPGPAAAPYRLLRAKDTSKDQSYFLYRLGQTRLKKTLFPLGEMTKAQVRALAARLGLDAAGMGESREVCFIPDDDYRALVGAMRPDALRPGEFVDKAGNVLGEHGGVAFYTVGQRRGLGVSSDRGRLYVVDRDPATNRITLGSEDDLMKTTCTVGSPSFVSGRPPEAPFRAHVKLHYRARPAPAVIEPSGETLGVRFDAPVAAVAPGQSAVFYDGDEVVGGGIIQ